VGTNLLVNGADLSKEGQTGRLRAARLRPLITSVCTCTTLSWSDELYRSSRHYMLYLIAMMGYAPKSCNLFTGASLWRLRQIELLTNLRTAICNSWRKLVASSSPLMHLKDPHQILRSSALAASILPLFQLKPWNIDQEDSENIREVMIALAPATVDARPLGSIGIGLV